MSPLDLPSKLPINPSLPTTAPADSLLNPPPSLRPVSPREAARRRLPRERVDELRRVMREAVKGMEGVGEGEVWEWGSERFRTHATVFNATIQSQAPLLVRPTAARQVSRILLFCRKQNLEVSVKGGGYGTHGWSVAGQVVLDMSLISQMACNLPAPSLPGLKDSVLMYANGTSSGVKAEDPKGKGRFEGNGAGPSGSRSGSSSGSPKEGTNGKQGGSGSSNGNDEVKPGMSARKRSATDAWAEETMAAGSSCPRPNPTASSSADRQRPAEFMAFGRPDGVASGSESDRNGKSKSQARESSASSSDAARGSGSGSGSGSRTTDSESSEAQRKKQEMMAGLGSISSSMLGNGYSEGVSYAHTTSPAAFTSPGGFNSFLSPEPGSSRYFDGSGSSSSSSGPMTAATSMPSSIRRDSHPAHILVSFGAGATSKQLDQFSSGSPWGPYFVPFAAFPVGTAVMLTGGFGFLSRAYGLSMDNLVELEMVLADGRIIWISQTSEQGDARCEVEWPDGKTEMMPDAEAKELWWGLRGAGTAMGVATRYRAKAYHVPIVFSGNLIYPFNPTTTPNLMRHVRDCVKGSSRNLYANIILTAGPNSLAGVVIIQLCYIGSRNEGAEVLSAIGSWDEERCLFKDVEERSFLEQQDSIANVLKGGAGRKWFIKSDLLDSLTDEIVWKTCQQFHTVPDGCTWLFEVITGALSDCKTTCLPQSHREATYTIAALHQWPVDMPNEDPRCVKTAVDWIKNVIHAKSPGGPFPCFAQSSHPDEVRGVYGENYDRIASLKHRVDPDNVFKHTLWPALDDPLHNTPLEILYGTASDAQPSRKQIWAEEDSKIGAEGIAGLYKHDSNGMPVISEDPMSDDVRMIVDGATKTKEIQAGGMQEELQQRDDGDMMNVASSTSG